ncbi:hypothetical protein ASE63_04010 [Bosea sp. Root381]|uniref:hypothetical protein n=1 Tax=Bosea sp. Root381 TaxID=1736524 RepID=UPI0006F5F37F|nr:hypothetical protein [Bosea sp. Root381]KRE09705.1 hypothetical protein ASE63_04010 [Bosea sp. Root381]
MSSNLQRGGPSEQHEYAVALLVRPPVPVMSPVMSRDWSKSTAKVPPPASSVTLRAELKLLLT